jgi:hypothetical protein
MRFPSLPICIPDQLEMIFSIKGAGVAVAGLVLEVQDIATLQDRALQRAVSVPIPGAGELSVATPVTAACGG